MACGALSTQLAELAEQRGWPLDVHPLPPLLHNHPREIPGQVAASVERLRPAYERVVVGYADCGTYGALDEVCSRLGVARLSGLHCYDVYAGAAEIRRLLEEEPGTYLLTDFLVRSFARAVLVELGLDRYPELRDAYFGHYTRVVWLAQDRDDPELVEAAQAAADRIQLPLTVIPTNISGLETEISSLTGWR